MKAHKGGHIYMFEPGVNRSQVKLGCASSKVDHAPWLHVKLGFKQTAYRCCQNHG